MSARMVSKMTAISWENEETISIYPDFVEGVKQPMISLNGKWYYTNTPPEEPWRQDTAFTDFELVDVPGEITKQNFEIESDKESYYKKVFCVPEDYAGKRIYLRFESVYNLARIWINGEYVRSHKSCNTSFDCDITEYVKPGEEAILTLGVTDCSDDISIFSAYGGHLMAGILRDVFLFSRPSKGVTYIHVNAEATQPTYTSGRLSLRVKANSLLKLNIELFDSDDKIVPMSGDVVSVSHTDKEEEFFIDVPKIKAWDSEHPNCYILKVHSLVDDTVTEVFSYQIGFRHITYGGREKTDKREIYVNGFPIKLHGTCLHDTYFKTGRAMDKEELHRQILLLVENNINFIRTSHYPPSKAFLDECDKAGIYVECETGVCFNHEKPDQEVRKDYQHRFISMLELSRNHPSVLIWSLGNESDWNDGVADTYDIVKKEDPTRPVIFSWPLSKEDKSRPLDIFSIHYLHFSDGLYYTDEHTYKDLPTLHDEFAHVPAYDIQDLRRDPNLHNFWGRSIKRYWEEMHTTPGMLGGSIWEGKDNVILLPHEKYYRRKRGFKAYSDTFEGSTWGCILDYTGRLKPEAWLVKEAYSPIRIETRREEARGGKITVPVCNWFNSTDLSEVTVKISTDNKTWEQKLPQAGPNQKCILEIPVTAGDKMVDLKFYDARRVFVDEHKVFICEHKEIATEIIEQLAVVNECGLLKVRGETFEYVFNTTDGLLIGAYRNGKKVLEKGPFIHTIGFDPGRLISGTIKHVNAQKEVVVEASYKYEYCSLDTTMLISGNGKMDLNYVIKDPVDDGRQMDEIGLKFRVPNSGYAVDFEREGIWSAYPEDHVGRNSGTAFRERPDFRRNPENYRQKMDWDWKDDMYDYSIFNASDPRNGLSTRDFRAMKENITHYSVKYLGQEETFSVIGDGTQSARMDYSTGPDPLIHVSDARIHYSGKWDRTALTGYSGVEYSSTEKGSCASLKFKGTGIRIWGSTGKDLGNASIWIDKKKIGEVCEGSELFSECPTSLIYNLDGLKFGDHEIEIVQASSGIRFAFSAVEILCDKKLPLVEHIIIDNAWNFPNLSWGNYVNDPVYLKDYASGSVHVKV